MLCRGFWGPKDHPNSGRVHWKNWTEERDKAERVLVDFMKENWSSCNYYNHYLSSTKLGLDFLDQHPKGSLKKLALYAYEVELDADTDDIKNVHTHKRETAVRLIQVHVGRRAADRQPSARDLQSGTPWKIKCPQHGGTQGTAYYSRFVKTRDRVPFQLSAQMAQKEFEIVTEAVPISDAKNQVYALQVRGGGYDSRFDYDSLPADVEIFSEGKIIPHTKELNSEGAENLPQVEASLEPLRCGILDINPWLDGPKRKIDSSGRLNAEGTKFLKRLGPLDHAMKLVKLTEARSNHEYEVEAVDNALTMYPTHTLYALQVEAVDGSIQSTKRKIRRVRNLERSTRDVRYVLITQ
jgi:hypothetical protein